jgi:[acyl-carrier-protein] S-malonyltransferase
VVLGRLAFLFPGQGSATVGMGESIGTRSPAAAGLLGQLDPTLLSLMRAGPKDELIRTRNAQPAIFAVDCACLAALDARGVRPDVAAGHSLGEYAALVAAGALDVATGLRLVAERGALMERSTAARPGTMLAVLGLEPARVAELVATWQDRGVIANANDNAPGQVVISGDRATLEAAAPDFRAAGGRVMPLPVGGAFHSALMQDARDAFVALLDAAPLANARIPVVPNLTAEPTRDAGQLKSALRDQITGSVRWRESIDAMLTAGVDTFVEVGPGKVLSGLVQRCARGRDVQILNVEDAETLERVVGLLGAR